jgi:hypothetical protein
MHLHNETPPLRANAGDGVPVVSKAVAAKNYQNTTFTATEFAASVVASKFHLPLSTARVICELADIGGRCA